MKNKWVKNLIGKSFILIIIGFTIKLSAAVYYEIEITNGLKMPISGGVIYGRENGASGSEIGTKASQGFINLCQMGDNRDRLKELNKLPTKNFIVQGVPGPTLPGQKRILNLQIVDPKMQSIHFEVMYGMTKDVCGVVTINSHTLIALAQRVTQEVVLGDQTVLTGAFMDPAIPIGSSYLDPDFCENNTTAIDCLRSNSLPNEGVQFIRSFSGYLPSFITAVEMKYGSPSTQQLLFPNTNGLQIKIRLKK